MGKNSKKKNKKRKRDLKQLQKKTDENGDVNEGLRGQARTGQPNQYVRPSNTQRRDERQSNRQRTDFSNQQWEGQHNQFGRHPNTQPGTKQPVQHTDDSNQQCRSQHNNYGQGRNTQPVAIQSVKHTETENRNVLFYQNKIPAFPNQDYIKDILLWTGKYDILEKNHSYIQWLFPNRVAGVNQHASILNDKEVQIIRTTRDLKANVLRAFEMMLDFYGMRLAEENQFELQRNAEERLHALNTKNNHNFRRICRILLALKELGHNHLMVPWLKLLADLIYKDKRLTHADKSFRDFWIETLDAEDKINLEKYLKSRFPEIFQKK